MSVFQMSISATILILAIVVIRSLAIHKLPKKTFLVLWGIALFQLLIPFYIPLPIGVYTVTDRVMGLMSVTEMNTYTPTIPAIDEIPLPIPPLNDIDPLVSEATQEVNTQFFPIVTIWIIGMVTLAMVFIVTHLCCRRQYKTALPLENDYVTEWLKEQKLWRSVQIRYSDKINVPLTYGIWKPVILFPKITDWQDKAGLLCVLTHELTHIKRFDVLTKWLIAAALCVHWFNPLVWVMYILANRDIEVACDETVVWTFGGTTKSIYALALLTLEEKRSNFSPLTNCFAKNAIKERINAIVKLKKRSVMSMTMAFMLVFAVAACALVINGQTNNTTNGAPHTVIGLSSSDELPLNDMEFLMALANDTGEMISEQLLNEFEQWIAAANPAEEIPSASHPSPLNPIPVYIRNGRLKMMLDEGFYVPLFRDKEIADAVYFGEWAGAVNNVNLSFDAWEELAADIPGVMIRMHPNEIGSSAHPDDVGITAFLQTPMEILAIWNADKWHYPSTEKKAYILERIELGLTVWISDFGTDGILFAINM